MAVRLYEHDTYTYTHTHIYIYIYVNKRAWTRVRILIEILRINIHHANVTILSNNKGLSMLFYIHIIYT